jgi:hypothetical protein
MKRASFVALSALAFGALYVPAQTPPQKTSGPAANAWMKTPSGAEILPSAPFHRSERDQFWDSTAATMRVPLTPDNAGAAALSEGAWSPNSPELPELPNRTILTATFTSFQSILTASGRTVYTDISFRVHDVIEGANASPNSSITVSIAGGTVKASDGKVISYLTQPRDMFLQPGRTYLLVLSYKPSVDFYTLGEDWDISDGTAKPNSYFGKWMFEHGHSSFAGKATDDALRDLRKHIAESHNN